MSLVSILDDEMDQIQCKNQRANLILKAYSLPLTVSWPTAKTLPFTSYS